MYEKKWNGVHKLGNMCSGLVSKMKRMSVHIVKVRMGIALGLVFLGGGAWFLKDWLGLVQLSQMQDDLSPGSWDKTWRTHLRWGLGKRIADSSFLVHRAHRVGNGTSVMWQATSQQVSWPYRRVARCGDSSSGISGWKKCFKYCSLNCCSLEVLLTHLDMSVTFNRITRSLYYKTCCLHFSVQDLILFSSSLGHSLLFFFSIIYPWP